MDYKIIAFTIYIIIDYPRLGFITVNSFEELLINQRASLD